MAKSLRSKSERKKRAIRCASIYQPVVDARVERIASRSTTMPVDAASGAVLGAGSHAMAVDATVDSVRRRHKLSRASRHNGRRARASLNAYGLSAKELFF